MKLPLLFVLSALASAPAGAQPTFEGYMVSKDRPQFALSSQNSERSGWLELGQSFEGFILVAFEPKSEILVLKKDGERQELRLRESKIQEVKPEEPNARLRSLKGMELAYELAKSGDEEIADLLKRYQEALLAEKNEQSANSAVKFLRASVEKKAGEKAAKILAGK